MADLLYYLKRAVDDQASDLFIIAGGPVPGERLPPARVPGGGGAPRLLRHPGLGTAAAEIGLILNA